MFEVVRHLGNDLAKNLARSSLRPSFFQTGERIIDLLKNFVWLRKQFATKTSHYRIYRRVTPLYFCNL
jgi:hypothetical protein